MELTLRDWMVIVGVLLILAVLLDAGRRILRERRAEVRLKLSRSSQRELDPEDLGISTPRVVRRSERESPRGESPGGRESLSTTRRTTRPGAAPPTTEDTSTAAPTPGAPTPGASTPGDPAAGAPAAGDPAAGAPAAGTPTESEMAADEALEPHSDPATGAAEPVASRRGRRRSGGKQRREPVISMDTAAPGGPSEREADTPGHQRQEPENLDWLDALDAEPEDDEPDDGVGQMPRDVEPEVFMLNVVSRKPAGFSGEDILHILLACDLRFGDMNFFHRHEQAAGRGPIQFSVANMLKPGVFDIDNMADFRTQGLSFFLTLPGPSNMMRAYDYMLETAQTVARNLDGDVLDETRSALTRQTLEHHRQRIRELERRLLLAQSSR